MPGLFSRIRNGLRSFRQDLRRPLEGTETMTRRQRWAALAQAVGGGLAGWATLQSRLLGADLGSAALLLGVMLFLIGTIRGIAPSRAPTE